MNDKQRLEKVHHFLSDLWDIPLIKKLTGKNKRCGVSTLFVLLPGGSTVALIAKAQFILVAHRNNIPKAVIYERLLIDWLLGVPPVLGSILTWLYGADDKIFYYLDDKLT